MEYREVRPSAAWAPFKGVVRDPAYHQFAYSGAGVGGTLEIRQTENGNKTLEMYYLKLGSALPREHVDGARALMDKVYESLRVHAPEIPPKEEVREELIRVMRD